MKNHVTRSLGLLFVLAAFSSAAFSSISMALPGAYIRSVSHAGSGCPAGTTAVRLNDNDILIDFDGMVAEAGPGMSLSLSRRNCLININLVAPAGWSYSVHSATYSGFVSLTAGASATQKTAYSFQGSGQQGTLSTNFSGPAVRDFRVTDDLTMSTLWSPCGLQRSLNINVQASVRASREAEALLSLDSPYNLSQSVHLAWRRCQ